MKVRDLFRRNYKIRNLIHLTFVGPQNTAIPTLYCIDFIILVHYDKKVNS